VGIGNTEVKQIKTETQTGWQTKTCDHSSGAQRVKDMAGTANQGQPVST